MPRNKVLEQHIAVFGASGSGKTVMLSSFCGSEQEPQNIKGAFCDGLGLRSPMRVRPAQRSDLGSDA